MNKRGITPLVATVLLIAFSVALGAVVMSWGETYIEGHLRVEDTVTEFVVGCDFVNLGVMKVDGEDRVCIGAESLEVFVTNGPNVDIASLKAQVIGDDVLNVANIIPSTLMRDSSLKATIPYKMLASAENKDLGTVKQLVLIPYILQQGQPVSCSNRAVTVSVVKGC